MYASFRRKVTVNWSCTTTALQKMGLSHPLLLSVLSTYVLRRSSRLDHCSKTTVRTDICSSRNCKGEKREQPNLRLPPPTPLNFAATGESSAEYDVSRIIGNEFRELGYNWRNLGALWESAAAFHQRGQELFVSLQWYENSKWQKTSSHRECDTRTRNMAAARNRIVRELPFKML